MKNISYKDLLCIYNGNEKAIPYSRLLETSDWRNRRLFILKRDSGNCFNVRCSTRGVFEVNEYGNSIKLKHEFSEDSEEIEVSEKSHPVFGRTLTKEWSDRNLKLVEVDENLILQVHHRYYVKGRLPWDYPDKALMTLCIKCHQSLHTHKKVHMYIHNTLGKLVKLEDCKSCSRCSGSGYLLQYKHVQNGVCFECGGSGFDMD